MRPIFFTADHHFGHKNIIEYCDRPFKSVEEMNFQMVNKWNKTVPKDARVYYLGDFGWGDKGRIETLLDRLNFRQLIWVKGNHDRSVSWCDSIDDLRVFAFKGPLTVQHEGMTLILTHEPIMGPAGSVNLHGHVHNSYFTEIEGRGYPEGPFRQRIRFNVGVDCNNFRPWRLSEVKAEIRKARA